MSDGARGQVITPVQSNTAILMIDLISDFNFKDGEKLFPKAMEIAENISRLKARARSAGVPVIYVNDNYGKWNEDFTTYTTNIRTRSDKGRQILDIIEPTKSDYFILKPQRSGFYATALGVLLLNMNVSNVVVTGVTTDICVLFTAHDAYMRGYHVRVPADCCTAVEQRHHDESLKFLERVAEANTARGASIDFQQARANGKSHGKVSTYPVKRISVE